MTSTTSKEYNQLYERNGIFCQIRKIQGKETKQTIRRKYKHVRKKFVSEIGVDLRLR